VSPSGPPDFDLTPYSPTLWLAADDMTGFADGDAVGGGDPDDWENLGSAGDDFTQATANRRPTYQTAEANGLPVVRFVNTPSGEEDRLESSTGILPNVISTSAYSGFAVVRPTVGGGTDGSSRYYRRPRIIGSAGNDNFTVGLYDQKFSLNHMGVTGPRALTPTTFTLNSWNIVEVYFTGAGGVISIRMNGGTETTVAAASNLSSITGAMRLGLGTDAHFDGDIAEIVFFNTALSSGDMTAIRNGLGAKYGITV
jgi:hypothetical protein